MRDLKALLSFISTSLFKLPSKSSELSFFAKKPNHAPQIFSNISRLEHVRFTIVRLKPYLINNVEKIFVFYAKMVLILTTSFVFSFA